MVQEEIPKPTASSSVTEPAPTLPKEEATVTEKASAPVSVENPVCEKEVSAPAPEAGEDKVVVDKETPVPEAEKPAVEEEDLAAVETDKAIVQSVSFKEESYVTSELPESQRKALEEFKELVREALNKREFTTPPLAPTKEEEKIEEKKEEVKEETKEETKEEDKKEVKEETAVTPAPTVVETKSEDKPAASSTTEIKQEEKSAVPAPVETKPADLAATEVKKEEKSTVASPAETKPATPVTVETKKEEKSAVPAPEETKPATPVTVETKKEEKLAVPAPEETKPTAPVEEGKPADPAPVPVSKSEEKPVVHAPEETTTIEKAFAAEEDDAKTVEAIEETIISASAPEAAAVEVTPEAEPVEPEEISIWGIPLLEDDRSDVVLLKFLRARDFKVKEAFTMLKNTVSWRKETNIDEIVGEDLGGSEFEKIVFSHGVDKEGRTVIYSSYGEFQNKQLFSDKEQLNKFLKWRIQFHEKCVRALDFSPAAKSSFLFVSDFRNAPGLGKMALWQFIRRAVKLFEDNYPEFSAKELLINVPWWYIPYYRTFGSIVTSPRTKSKMVLAGPSKSPDTIFKYIAPEQVPIKYGGLSKESSVETLFGAEETVTEDILKPAANHTIVLPASEACTVSWELRVLGSDVSYGAQFEPSTEGSYTVIVSKNRKISLADEPVITDSFKVGEPGNVVITVDNQTSKKKKLLYRSKTQPKSD